MADLPRYALFDLSYSHFPNGSVLAKEDCLRPEDTGFRLSTGLPKGQIRDWRKRVGNGCVHVREYRNTYVVHRDKVDPRFSIIGHIIKDVLGL